MIDTIIDQARTGEIGDGKIFGVCTFQFGAYCEEASHVSPDIYICIYMLTNFICSVIAVSPVSDIIRIRTGISLCFDHVTRTLSNLCNLLSVSHCPFYHFILTTLFILCNFEQGNEVWMRSEWLGDELPCRSLLKAQMETDTRNVLPVNEEVFG